MTLMTKRTPARKIPDDHSTLREHFAWTYGNLAMVHAAIDDGATKFGRLHFMIRGRFRKQYLAGTMKMRPLDDDATFKDKYRDTCCYCGREFSSKSRKQREHVIPQFKGGPLSQDNMLWACRSCNTSKGARDMVMWLVSRGRFPAVFALRVYLKLAARWSEDIGLMDVPWDELPEDLCFAKRSLRAEWPPLTDQRLWPDEPES